MDIPVRRSVKILLLNGADELLLMCADDPRTTTVDGKSYGRYWFTPGGKIEGDETFLKTAQRELYEETGIQGDEVVFGPVVWQGEFDLALAGKVTRLNQHFIVAKTKKTDISFANLTDSEQRTIKKCAWFSLDKIRDCQENIFPVVMADYLPDILAEKYPCAPLEIDLGKQPD